MTKLAKGGIVDTDTLFVAGEHINKPCIIADKYYKIYKRTKNRRIKKKQEKKSFMLQIIKSIDNETQYIKQPITIKVFVGGKEFNIEKEVIKNE